MKQNFTGKMIFGSLIFPLSIFLIFGIGFVLFSIGEGFNALRLGCLFSAFLGGLLPVLITLIAKTDTSPYLKNRSFALVIFLIFIIMALGLNALFDSIVYAWSVLFLSVIISTIYFIRKCRTGLERLIVIISNPILYLTACLICFGRDFISAFGK